LANGYGEPRCELGDGGIYFRPTQVAVGPNDSVYVVSEFDLLQVDADGGIQHVLNAQAIGGEELRAVATTPGGTTLFASSGGPIWKIVGSTPVLFAGDIAATTCSDSWSDGGGGAFYNVTGIAADSTGNVFVSDQGQFEGTCTFIQEAAAPDGRISTVAGNGGTGFDDGSASVAEFWDPNGIAVDQAGNLYVADTDNYRIRKIAPDGTTTTLSGTGSPGFNDGTGGENGTATFNQPNGVAVDSNGYVYVADTLNNAIRRVAPDGTTITLTGNGPGTATDGTLAVAHFNVPTGITVGLSGDIYVADQGNCRLRVIHVIQQ